VNKTALKNGSYSAVISVIVIAVIVIINLALNAVSTKYTMIDVSSQKLYTIGDDTKDVLKKLDQDVTIYYLTDDSDEDATITMLLDNYAANSKHITIEKKDPAVYPGFASQYTDDSLTTNSLIVVSGDKSKCLDYQNDLYISELDYTTYEYTNTGFDGEGCVTAAITYVTSDETPVIYNITGHDEASIDSTLQKDIEKLNLQIEDLTLLTEDGIPDDAAGIIISAPASDFSSDDVEKVEKYMDAGGHALIFTNYTDADMKNFKELLKYYNMELADGVVMEGDSSHYTSQNPMYLVPEVSTSSNLTQSVTDSNGLVFSPISQGLTKIDEDSDVSVEYLLTTSDSSYSKTDVQGMETYAKEDGDVDGPFAVGASVYKTIGDDDTDGTVQMRMAVFTSASFAMSSADEMVSGSNFKLITDTISWLTNVDETSSIASKSIDISYLTVSAAKVLRWSVILVAVVPIVILLFGGVVWFVRRKK
jgi:ABC-2 type transport system permease protein